MYFVYLQPSVHQEYVYTPEPTPRATPMSSPPRRVSPAPTPVASPPVTPKVVHEVIEPVEPPAPAPVVQQPVIQYIEPESEPESSASYDIKEELDRLAGKYIITIHINISQCLSGKISIKKGEIVKFTIDKEEY